MSEFTEFIYTLSDPRDKRIRYVGRTSDVQARYFGHLSTKGSTEKDIWIDELRQLGIRPEMSVIEKITYTTPVQEAQKPSTRERFWVEHFEQSGEPLLNKYHRSDSRPPIIYNFVTTGSESLAEENARLRAENERLQAIIEQIKQLVDF